MDVHEKLRIISDWSIKFDLDRDANGMWFATVFTMRTDTKYFTLSYTSEVEAIDEALLMAQQNALMTISEVEEQK